MREKYVVAGRGKHPLGPNTVSLGKAYIFISETIQRALGSHVGLFYDRKERILSLVRGSGLKIRKGVDGHCSQIGWAGAKAFFAITHKGQLEATWNKKEKSWDILIPRAGR